MGHWRQILGLDTPLTFPVCYQLPVLLRCEELGNITVTYV